MASGEQPSPSRGKRQSGSNSSTRNGLGEGQWMLLPNNLELSSRSRPAKKQRNKDKVRSLPPENFSSSVNSAQASASNTVPEQNFPRAKFNTATWLKAQLVNDEKCKRQMFDLDEILSDSSATSQQVVQRGHHHHHPPTNQRLQATRQQYPQGATSRKTVMENENTKSVKDECRKNEADSAIIFERISHLKDFLSEASSVWQNLGIAEEPEMKDEIAKLKNAVKKITEEEREHKALLQQMIVSEASGLTVNGISPSSTHSRSSFTKGNAGHRDVNGAVDFYTEEEQMNKCNHLIEKMKKSEERLAALQQQESILYQMQKKAENKLAAYRAMLDKNEVGAVGNSNDQSLPVERAMHGVQVNESAINTNDHWEETFQENQRQWTSENSLNTNNTDQGEFQASNWKDDPQDLRKLHISLEHIKKRVQSIQQVSDNKNVVTDVCSSDECEEVSDISERAAMVKWERKKLKNKLVELQEKKKKNDELLMELSFLKDAANMVNSLKHSEDAETNFLPSTSRDTCQQLSKDKRNSKKIEELQATLEHLQGMMNAMTPESNVQDAISGPDVASGHSQSIGASSSQESSLPPRQGHAVPATKRDNVSKEQNAGFPARRHYEAEGRANEDADMPPALVPAASPTPEDSSWQENPRIQEKIRKLQVARDRLKMIQGLMGTIQEAKQNGKQIPLDHLQLLSSLEEEDQDDDMYDEDNVSNDDDKDEGSSSPHNVNEHAAISNENSEEISQKALFENLRKSQEEAANLEAADLKSIIRERCRLAMIHDQVVRLRKLLPPTENKNDDRVRSSGEGGNSQRQKPQQQGPHPSDLQPKLRQDNLQLTRQNIATMESQNRNSNPNASSRECSSFKKDNINNLSGKMGKLSIQNAVNGSVSETSRDNLDTMSSFSTEMNQSFTLQNDMQRKAVLDILNQDQTKQKSYLRNQDIRLGSNSSEDSEPLEGSNSALAPDTTVAATWGGSSTQDNFEDENEESLEDQEGEEGANIAVATESEHVSQVQFADQYSNFPQYADMASNINDKKKENGRTDGFQQMQPNQWPNRKNFPAVERTRPQAPTSRIPAENDAGASGLQSQETPQAQAGPVDAAADYHLKMSSKFILQLREQIDQLNALCQQRFFQDRQPTPVSSHQNPNCAPHLMTNPHHSVPANPEIMLHYNQQLLLSLSQCYHILFMQQLEIQHLQRCVRQQNVDSESIHHSNSASTQASTAEEFTLRPWFLSPWLSSTMPSIPFPTSQVSPMAASPFFQSTPDSAFSFNQHVMLPNTNPPCSSVPGPQPVRAVVHPAAQEIRPNSETLNNQVPPRTRANNFLDNFRSYSRQNLLSTSSNVKRNENVGLPVAPQIRQVHPLVSNENAPTHRTREPLHIDGSNIVVAVPHLSERPVPNPELQELMNRSKKPNSSRHQAVFSNRSIDASRRSLLTNITSSDDQPIRSNRFSAQNIEPTLLPSVSTPSSVNFSQPCQIQMDSKIGSFSNISIPPAAEATAPPLYSEISNLVAQNENQPEFLLELFHELQNLKSDTTRQRALNLVRDLALVERRSDDETSPANKNRNDHTAAIVKSEVLENIEPQYDIHTESGSSPCITSGPEFPTSRGTTEASSQWNSQNLPTAAIPPLGKHVASKPVSTGAVKKKTMSKSPLSCTFASPSWDQPATLESSIPSTAPSSTRSMPDSSENVVEKVVIELIPYVRGQVMLDDSSPIFRANVCSRIIDVLKANLSTTLPNRCISQLRQALEQLMIKYSGLKWYECESDFLKSIAEFLFKELSLFKSTGQFSTVDEPADIPGANVAATSLEMCPQPDLLPSVCKSNEKRRAPAFPKNKEETDASDASNYFLQQESEEQTNELSIKMPAEEIAVFPVHFNGPLPQEHIRGAIGGESSYLLHSHIQPIRAVTAEEDMGCECDPEAEAEPEVEAGTEADLAEADQSPGQQSTAVNSASIDSWAAEQSGRSGAAGAMLSNGEEHVASSDNSESGHEAQLYPDACAEPEVSLDDIPTKLSPLSEEELQRQMKDEQFSNSLLLDVVDEISLVGECDVVREPK